jgi:hypothetical protein
MGDKKRAPRNLLLLYGLVHYLGKRIELSLGHAMRLSILFCLSSTLSFKDVLEFGTKTKEKLDVEKKAFDA